MRKLSKYKSQPQKLDFQPKKNQLNLTPVAQDIFKLLKHVQADPKDALPSSNFLRSFFTLQSILLLKLQKDARKCSKSCLNNLHFDLSKVDRHMKPLYIFFSSISLFLFTLLMKLIMGIKQRVRQKFSLVQSLNFFWIQLPKSNACRPKHLLEKNRGHWFPRISHAEASFRKGPKSPVFGNISC